jgi:aspartate aminotransferase
MSLGRLRDSPAFEIFNQVSRKEAAGERVFSLAIGEPSFDTPAPIVRAAFESMKRGEVHYVPSTGTKALREAIVGKVRRKNELVAEMDNVVFLTTKLAIYAALLSASDGPYEALVPDPGYYYEEPVILSGGKPVRYRLGQDFGLDLDEVKRVVTSRTRAVVLNTPSNPTGKVFGARELRSLLDFCRERKMCVISDEAYEDLVYEKKHVSIGSMEESPELVISLFSLSKSYAMTGWRAGYVVGSHRTVRRINRFLENTMTCFPPFIQAASAYALLRCDRYVSRFREELRRRRGMLEEIMVEIPMLECQRTEGAFYNFPRFKPRTRSVRLARALLEKENVAVLPGSIFGPAGEGHLRISFGSSPDAIVGGMKRVKSFFDSLGS